MIKSTHCQERNNISIVCSSLWRLRNTPTTPETMLKTLISSNVQTRFSPHWSKPINPLLFFFSTKQALEHGYDIL